MRSSLLWKHVGITVLVIIAAISVVWLAIDYLAADYFIEAHGGQVGAESSAAETRIWFTLPV